MAEKNRQTTEARPFLVQIYFVLASLIGLILMVISGVTLSRLVLNELIGVKEYPSFSAPYPVKDPGIITAETEGLTPEQKESLAQWEKEYADWQQREKEFNSEDQNRRRQIAESLAMLIVGLPVFGFHAPYVFKRA